MISTRVPKVEAIGKLIPVIDELSKWYEEHGRDVNGQYSQARFQKRRIENKARTATRIYRLCMFRGDSFITIDIDHVEAYEALTVENIRADLEEYARLRAVRVIEAAKPVVTYGDEQRAHDAVLWSLLIITVSLIGIFSGV